MHDSLELHSSTRCRCNQLRIVWKQPRAHVHRLGAGWPSGSQGIVLSTLFGSVGSSLTAYYAQQRSRERNKCRAGARPTRRQSSTTPPGTAMCAGHRDDTLVDAAAELLVLPVLPRRVRLHTVRLTGYEQRYTDYGTVRRGFLPCFTQLLQCVGSD